MHGTPAVPADATIPLVTLLMAAATNPVSAPPDRVRAFLRDYHARPRILTDSYRDYRVEEGGEGQGTVFSYTFVAPGRPPRTFRMRVEESDETLFERDQSSSFVSNWTVDATATGSSVTLEASWEGSGGIGGFFERLFAPMSLRRTYAQILENLASQLQG
jgi:hypothetical protein